VKQALVPKYEASPSVREDLPFAMVPYEQVRSVRVTRKLAPEELQRSPELLLLMNESRAALAPVPAHRQP
jgi:hypothetical protein